MNHHDYLPFNTSAIVPETPGDSDYHIIFFNDMLLMNSNGKSGTLPRRCDIPVLFTSPQKTLYIGQWRGTSCYASAADTSEALPDEMSLHSLRTLLSILSEEEFLLCARARQLLQWNNNHCFCGQCGTPTQQRNNERAKECPQCGLIAYPRISPATIVAVIRNNTILLAHNATANHRFYSVLAGFLEPGESFENCVKREVFEEVGIRVKNIRYFGSEPWPFPDSLMVAFTAEYDSGILTVDGVEIDHADWYLPDNLPAIPGTGSISRKLIDWFLTTYST